MGMRAAAEYLRALREARGLTQEAVARETGVVGKTVWNWETGDREIPSTKLAEFVRLVRGSAEDVIQLLAMDDATDSDGRIRAEAWLSQERDETPATRHDSARIVQATLEVMQS